jgi:hypothetical protein
MGQSNWSAPQNCRHHHHHPPQRQPINVCKPSAPETYKSQISFLLVQPETKIGYKILLKLFAGKMGS